MSRTTRPQVESMFRRLCSALGKPCANEPNSDPRRSHADPSPPVHVPHGTAGAWFLDYSAPYGGYVVHEYVKGGGETEPFGPVRCSAGEMWERLRFAWEAINLAKGGK